MSAKEKPGIMMYWEVLDTIKELPDKKAKIMICAMYDYSRYNQEPNFEKNGELKAIWAFIKHQIDKDSERYANKRTKSLIAGFTSNFKRNYAPEHGIDPNDKDALDQYIKQRLSTDVDECQPTPTTTSTSATTSTPTTTSTPATTSNILNTSPLTPQGGTEPLKESYPESFEDFWEMYPRKEAKKDALKAFQKLKPDSALIEKMLAALDQQKKSEAWKKDGGQYIPLPASWIRGERWEDEIKKPQEEGRRWKILL